MGLLKLSTAYTRLFLLVQSADHVSGLTGVAPAVTISKAGAAFGAAAGVVSELASGWYKIALTAADTNTLGDLAYHITAAGADPSDLLDQVIAADLADAAGLGLSRLDATVGSRLATAGYTAPPSAATVADTVWEEVVPAAYVSGTAGAALGRITAAALTVISPVAESGDVSVIRGDDYLAANGRALEWSSVDWPTLTGGAILLSVQKDAGTVWTKAGTVTAPTAVRVELTAAETVALGAGTYPFDIQATVGGAVTTLLRGTLVVSEDAR